MPRPETRHIGTDRVVLEGDRLRVVSPIDMAGWDVRRNRASVIRFDGRTWRVTTKTTNAAGTTEYRLVPWIPGEQDLTGPEIDYDADYVALRDHTHAVGRQRSRVTGLLGIVTPLTGFLPARTKARLEATYGIDPTASTFQSVFGELLIVLGAIVLAFLGSMVPSIPVLPMIGLAIVAAVDGLVRWDSLVREVRPPPGFYEWLFRRRPPPRGRA